MVLASSRSISGLGRSIGWLVVHGLLVGAHVVDVVLVLSVTASAESRGEIKCATIF